MDEYQAELIKEIRSEAKNLGSKASRIIELCEILLGKPSEISPEKEK